MRNSENRLDTNAELPFKAGGCWAIFRLLIYNRMELSVEFLHYFLLIVLLQNCHSYFIWKSVPLCKKKS